METTITRPNVKTTRKPRKATQGKPRGKQRHALKQVEIWAHRYVVGAVVISTLLNGYAAYHESSSYFGAIVGALPPLAVLGLAKVAGWLYKGGLRPLAYTNGAIGIFVLGLSLCHCALAIQLLTGVQLWLAWALAIGIDCGLVGCETAAIRVSDER